LKTIGFAVCGSFCTFDKVFEQIENLVAHGYKILPIMSENAWSLDTRFGRAADWRERFAELTGEPVIHTLPEAEPIGPKKLLDALVIAPATGNTLAKLAAGVTDTCVTLAAKAHLRNARPVLIAPSTNDGLTGAAKNIGALLNYKHVFFVPYGHDSYEKKPASLVAEFTLLPAALEAALENEQLRPVVITPK